MTVRKIGRATPELKWHNQNLKYASLHPAIPPPNTYLRETHKYAQRGTCKEVDFNNIHKV